LTDALLFLHLLSAAAVVCAVVAFTSVALGARLEPAAARVFSGLWGGGLLGVIAFGVALAIDVEGYDLWDAWVLTAIVLWLAAGGTGDRLSAGVRRASEEGAALPAALVRTNWIVVALVVLLLADMIWKPWA
jgi:hypothetical protein